MNNIKDEVEKIKRKALSQILKTQGYRLLWDEIPMPGDEFSERGLADPWWTTVQAGDLDRPASAYKAFYFRRATNSKS